MYIVLFIPKGAYYSTIFVFDYVESMRCKKKPIIKNNPYISLCHIIYIILFY